MGEVIKNIVLSSGKVVDLPVFPNMYQGTLPQPFRRFTRYNACIYTYTLGGYSSLLSDEDLLEFCNVICGTDCTILDKNLPSATGNYLGAFIWHYNNSDGKYYLNNDLSYTSTTMSLSWTLAGQRSDRFFNGVSYYSGELHNFNDVVAHASTSSSQAFYNYVSDANKLVVASNNGAWPTMYTRTMTATTMANNIAAYKAAHPDSPVTAGIFDPDDNTDPFIPIGPAPFGGGDGDSELDPDDIDKMPIPDLPTVSATDTGLVTLYTATNAQLQSLGAYLWSNLWDIETNFKKLFSDPMNCLVGLSIVPVTPSAGGAQNVKFGNITTNIALNVLSSQYVELDCGSVSIKEYVGSFLDYSPYVNISIYLPYVGYRELSPDDVMNDTIHVVYHVDVLSGGCCAMVETGKKGLLYSFNGSCITNVPITAINYSGAIQNAVSAVGAGLTTVAGIATGAAPLTAVGAASMLSSAANTAMNSKPTIQRSGAMGGAAGLMSCQKPFLVITRPRMSVPDKLNKFVGLTTNVTMNLSQVKGFTQVEHVHLSGIAATEDEKDELQRLLRQGVIF